MISIDHLNIIFIHKILSFTCRDLYGVAEEERKGRQHMDKLLSIFVNDVDGFRRSMRRTGSVRSTYRGLRHSFLYRSSFRTREVKATQIGFYNVPLELSKIRLWLRGASLVSGDSLSSARDMTVRTYNFMDMMISKYHHCFILRFRGDFWVFPKTKRGSREYCAYVVTSLPFLHYI